MNQVVRHMSSHPLVLTSSLSDIFANELRESSMQPEQSDEVRGEALVELSGLIGLPFILAVKEVTYMYVQK